jgi:hypothetical protein
MLFVAAADALALIADNPARTSNPLIQGRNFILVLTAIDRDMCFLRLRFTADLGSWLRALSAAIGCFKRPYLKGAFSRVREAQREILMRKYT